MSKVTVEFTDDEFELLFDTVSDAQDSGPDGPELRALAEKLYEIWHEKLKEAIA